jgi:hypothetical protein
MQNIRVGTGNMLLRTIPTLQNEGSESTTNVFSSTVPPKTDDIIPSFSIIRARSLKEV